MSLRKQQQAIAARANAANPAAPPSDAMDVQQTPQTSPVALHSSPPRGTAEVTPAPAPAPVPGAVPDGQQPAGQRQSWEYIDEVVNILKTAFPLLVLSLETVCEQFTRRFKQTPEEEQYRIICILCTDAIQVSCCKKYFCDHN
jgi:transformation/transcription domain-associated protein